MRAYWDSSALVEATSDLELRIRLRRERGITRTHSLAETFSALTSGNLRIRLDADAAAETIGNLAVDLDFVDLTPAETLEHSSWQGKEEFEAGVSTIFFTLSRLKSRELKIC